MGCSASKNLTVELDGSKVQTLTNELQVETRKNSIPRRASDVPPVESTEPQTEILGNGLGELNNVHQTPNGFSFDVPALEDSDSIIKKHPPKRFQKLEDQQTNPMLSLAKLQEKLDEAEIRRQQILQQRVQSAKDRYALRKQGSGTSHELDDTHLKVPPDIPKASNPYDVSYL